MPTTCETYAGDIEYAYDFAESKLGLYQSTWQSMTTQMHTTQLTTWHQKLLSCFSLIQTMLEQLIWGNYACAVPKRVPYSFINCVGGVVDMDAIISAMLTATFDQLQYFIGIEDAYRVALWNAPFNADFYAALARGFQKWP